MQRTQIEVHIHRSEKRQAFEIIAKLAVEFSDINPWCHPLLDRIPLLSLLLGHSGNSIQKFIPVDLWVRESIENFRSVE